MSVPGLERTTSPELREELASLVHEQWAHWTSHMLVMPVVVPVVSMMPVVVPVVSIALLEP